MNWHDVWHHITHPDWVDLGCTMVTAALWQWWGYRQGFKAGKKAR